MSKEAERKPVQLRAIRSSDLARIHGWLKRSDIRKNVLLGREVGPFQRQVDWFRMYKKDKTKMVFAILHGGKHVGNVSLFKIDKKNGNALINIFIGETASRGKGIAASGLKELFKLAFRKLGMKRLALKVLDDNLPAINCYQSVGMVREGKLRSCIKVYGKYRDMLVFSVLSEDVLR